jgi:DNA-binding NarL/FixJ family response regulator
VTIRVLLADDQELVRTGFRMILEAEPDIEVVGEAIDGREAVDQAKLLRPDVVLMDVRMPGVDGLEATRRLVESKGRSRPQILILTTLTSTNTSTKRCAPAQAASCSRMLPPISSPTRSAW